MQPIVEIQTGVEYPDDLPGNADELVSIFRELPKGETMRYKCDRITEGAQQKIAHLIYQESQALQADYHMRRVDDWCYIKKVLGIPITPGVGWKPEPGWKEN